jgi:hemerythrin-like domain-containing protein
MDQMDVLQLLKEDHDKIKKILTHLESTTERGVKTREEFYTKVRAELQVHEAIEEEILYPALKEHPKAKDLVLEAYEEHNVVDMVIAEIDALPYDDETWGAKLTVMRENVEHHIGEEESEMFEQCRNVFDRDELAELGDRMEARKEELQRAMA